MSIFLICFLAVFPISYLLMQIDRRDPFADENARCLLFPQFRVQRLIAKTCFVAMSGALLSAGTIAVLVVSPITTMLALSASLYLVIGTVLVLREVDNLAYERRSADPILHGIVLTAAWPVWKTQYRLQTRIN